MVMELNELEQPERTLHENPDALADIIGSAMEAIIAVDDAQRIVLFNAAAEKMFCCLADQVMGDSIERFIPQRFRAGHRTHVSRFAESGITHRTLYGLGTLWGVRATGEEFPIEASISKVESGNKTFFTAVIRDITERKLAEEARFRHAAIIESSDDAIVSGTLDGIIVSWNAGAQRIYGYTEAEAVGESITILVPPELPDEENKILETLRAGGRIEHFETVRVTKTGKRINVSLTISPIKDSTGRTVGISGIARDITERKVAEERLREYERAVEGSEEMFCVVDRDYRYLIANRQFLKMRNMTREQVLGRFAHEVLNKDFFEAVVKTRLNESFQGKVVRYETKYTYPESGERNVLVSYFPIEGANGIDRVACIVQDITDRKRAEETLRESEQRFRLAAQVGKIYSFEWDVTTDVVVRSSEYVNVLGATEPRTLTHQQAMERIHPDDRPKLVAAVARHSPESPTVDVTYRVLVPGGKSPVWVKSSGRAFFDPEGRIVRVIGMVADITEQKQVEDAIKESETRYRRIVETTNEGVWLLDSKLHTSYVNRQMAEMLGYEPREMVGQSVFDFYFSEDVDRKRQVLSRRQEGLREQIEERLRRKDGSELWVRMAANPVFTDNGKFDGAFAMVCDITGRKLAEDALQESEQRFRLVANTAPVMIWMSGLDKKPTYFNQLWLDFTGLSETDLQNGLAGIVHPDDYQHCLQNYGQSFDQRQPFKKECRLRRHDGQYRWMLDIGVPRFHKDGSFAGYIGSCIDVTDHKLAEQALSGMTRKLVEAQEQERARIARELHDDIIQRLAMLAVELGQAKQNHPDLLPDILNWMHGLQQQTTQISVDVRTLSHDLHCSQLEYLGVVAGIKSWCKEFGERHGTQIDFRHDVQSTLPAEIGLCLFRVLQEALHNAAKDSGVKQVEVQLAEDSNEVHLIVSDSGRGFDVEAVKQGKGLGLTSMRERVRLVNGTIVIESKPMRGTTIHVRVPIESTNVSQRAAVEQRA